MEKKKQTNTLIFIFIRSKEEVISAYKKENQRDVIKENKQNQ
jgi:hypothetical protein